MNMNKRCIWVAALCTSLSLPLVASAFDMAKTGEMCKVSSGFDRLGIVDHDGILYEGVNLEKKPLYNEVESVSVGANKLAFIRSGGSLYSYNFQIAGAKPEKVAEGVQAISVGTTHMALIKVDRALWTLGTNDKGQLGNGTRTNADKPVKVMDNVKAVSAGNKYTLALKTDNSLWAFGINTYGQLGDGTELASLRPVKIMENVASFSAGYSHSLIVTTEGVLYSFGCNEFGQLGNGTTTHSNEPIKIMENVASASAGYHYSAVVDKKGNLYTFGDNFYGQLGTGSKNTSATDVSANRWAPVKVMGDVRCVSAGRGKTVAVLENGLVYSFGEESIEPVFAGYNVRNGSVPMEAIPTLSKLNIDGYVQDIDAYQIGGNHYLKLRDIATFLILSEKSFAVEQDEGGGDIFLKRGAPYILNGSEMIKTDTGIGTAYPSNAKIFVDDREADIAIYEMGGNSYVKLRDMGKLFNFAVTWKPDTNTIEIRSFNSYENGVNK